MGRARKRRKSHKKKFLVGGFFIFAAMAAVIWKGHDMKQEQKQYESRMNELDDKIAEEKERAEEIEAYRDYVKSDEYVEKVARDKLGLVYEDEVLLKANEDE